MPSPTNCVARNGSFILDVIIGYRILVGWAAFVDVFRGVLCVKKFAGVWP